MPPIQYTHASDGTRIAYTIVPGDSPPWLHMYTIGAPPIEITCSLEVRATYMRELAQGRATVLFDHRGSGFSGPIEREIRLDDLVDDVAAVTAAVGVEMDVSVMSTSSLLAISYAATGGAGWRSMVLLGGPTRFAGGWHDRLLSIWRDGSYVDYRRAITRASMDVSLGEVGALVDRLVALVPEETEASYYRALRDADVSHLLADVALPTLVVTSPALGESAAQVAAAIGNAPLALLPSLANQPGLGAAVRGLWEQHLAPRVCRTGAHSVSDAHTNLSPRETDVLRLVAAGRTNADVAASLTLSVRTVERHLENIYRKTGAANRAAAAAWAIRQGLA